MWTILNIFIEFVTALLLFYVLVFGLEICGVLAAQGLILHPFHWKAKS